jgi:hypothetical protein
MIPVGFARADISSCADDGTGFRRPLEVVCASLGKGDQRIVVVALDLIEVSLPHCRQLASDIGGKLAINPDAVLIHTTHTHSAPWNRSGAAGPTLPGLWEIVAECATRAIADARPARVRVGSTDVGQSLSIYRRGDAGPDLGVQTFWFGYTFHENDDRPDASALANDMRSRWLRKGPAYEAGPEPVWFDRPVDPTVQAMAFEDADGGTIGTFIRFCAHPHLASSCRNRLYDPDYPAVVRDTVQTRLGGTCMFLLGPSANLVPKERVKYVIDKDHVPPFPYVGPISALYPESDDALLAEMQRIGDALGQAALEALEKSPAAPMTSMRFAQERIALPLDPALPRSEEEVQRLRAALVPEYEAFLNRGGPPRELRSLANRLNWVEWAATKSLGALTDGDRDAGEVALPVSVAVVNDTPVVFMHSEVPMETTAALRAAFPDSGLWTVSLTGGSIEYIPTAEMIDGGGYEGRSTVIRRDAEQKLREGVCAMLKGLRSLS